MNKTVFDAWGESIKNGVANMSEKELQGVIDRPFEPSPGNKDFDFEKWCAQIELYLRKKDYTEL